MTIDIREIAYGSEEYKALLKLRYEILRKPRGIKLSGKDTAADAIKFHIAAFENGQPIGCVLLKSIDSHTMLLHQMAVSDARQGQGIGTKLVRYAEELAITRGFETIEMYANNFAQGFYEKLGYLIEGDEFIENTVPSIKMHKPLRAVLKDPIQSS